MSYVARLDAERTVGWISILSFIVCLLAIYAIIAAVDYDASLGYLPVEAIEVADPALVFAWAVLDFIGYYLLRAPLILLFWHWFRPDNPVLVDSATFCGLLFIVLAVVATSVLTGATMGVMAVYPEADASLRIGLEAAWEASVASVRGGLWQFSMIPWAIWTSVMGCLLLARERALAIGLLSIAVAATISAVDPVFGPNIAAKLGPIHDYQVHFSSVWMLWAGIVLLRRARVADAS